MTPYRMLELESIVDSITPEIATLAFFKSCNLSFDEIMYLSKAVLLPINEFQNYVHHPMDDDIMKKLCLKYKASEETIKERVEEAKIMTDYLKDHYQEAMCL